MSATQKFSETKLGQTLQGARCEVVETNTPSSFGFGPRFRVVYGDWDTPNESFNGSALAQRTQFLAGCVSFGSTIGVPAFNAHPQTQERARTAALKKLTQLYPAIHQASPTAARDVRTLFGAHATKKALRKFEGMAQLAYKQEETADNIASKRKGATVLTYIV